MSLRESGTLLRLFYGGDLVLYPRVVCSLDHLENRVCRVESLDNKFRWVNYYKTISSDLCHSVSGGSSSSTTRLLPALSPSFLVPCGEVEEGGSLYLVPLYVRLGPRPLLNQVQGLVSKF